MAKEKKEMIKKDEEFKKDNIDDKEIEDMLKAFEEETNVNSPETKSEEGDDFVEIKGDEDDVIKEDEDMEEDIREEEEESEIEELEDKEEEKEGEKEEEKEEEMEEEMEEENEEEMDEKKENKKKEKVKEVEEKDIESEKKASIDIKEALSGLIKAFSEKVAKLEKMEPKVEEATKTKGAEHPKADEGDEGKKEIKNHVKSSIKWMEKKAMDGNNWSVNPKEVENPSKVKDPKDNFSVNKKEVNSEALKKPGIDSEGAKAIKDLYNKLQPASDEYSISFDKKSSLKDEIESWKKRVAELEKERQELLRRQQEYEQKLKIKALSEEMFKIVSSLKAKNLIEPGTEEDVIDIISSYFADEKLVDGLNKIASYLKPNFSDEIGKLIPQVELNENIEIPTSEPEEKKLSKIWVSKTLKNI